MPELPEVETIRRGLESKIIGLTITDVKILNPKSFQGDPKDIIGRKITCVFRRAKILGITLESSLRAIAKQSINRKVPTKIATSSASWRTPRNDDILTILFHLKMSGQVILQGVKGNGEGGSEKFVGGHPTKDMLGELPNRSTRVIFTLNDNSKIYFNDQRKFGWVKISVKGEGEREKSFEKLGPEPLEKGFTVEILKKQLQKRKNTAIKVVLLDQQIVSGIGNIYASEACFIAKINPSRRVRDLSDTDLARLHQAIIQSLSDGIKYGGSTKTHFVNADGKKGLFLDYAFVYSREGSACKICRTILTKIRLGGRGTVYCPQCQI